MRTQSPDTSPAAERVQMALFRAAPSWRKLEIVHDLNHTVRTLALSGLRRRSEQASSATLRRQLATMLLGDDLAPRVYGSHPIDDAQGDEDVTSKAVEVTLLVVEQLEALGIPYALGGSLASSVHGVPRSTNDSDVVADMRIEQVDALVRVIAPAFYIDGDAIRDAIQHRSSFNVIHLASMFKVDVFLPRNRAFDASQLARRRVEVVERNPDVEMYVASPEDNVLAKLEWYRMGGDVSNRQWEDVLGILKVRADDIDKQYLRHWAARLGLSDLLLRAFDDAGIA